MDQLFRNASLLLCGAFGGLAFFWLPMVALEATGGSFAGRHERGELAERYPERWLAWRRVVRAWIPRWRPPVDGERAFAESMPILYISSGCGPCSALRHWLESRHPRGLCLRMAEEHPARDLDKITYDPCDGSPEEAGVRAFARALEHLHFSWALVGIALRLPIVAPLAQLFADALGFGPRRVPRNPPERARFLEAHPRRGTQPSPR